MRNLEWKRSESIIVKRLLSGGMLLSALLICISILYIPVWGASTESQISASGESTALSAKWNVMMLIDKSGSMNGSDKDRQAIEAAKMFIDELASTENDEVASYTDLAIMSFSLQAEKVTEFSSIKSVESRDYAKTMVDGIQYEPSSFNGKGGTDLGIAVEAAANALDAHSEEGEKNMIVLFTDGWSQNVVNQKLSKKSLENGFRVAAELGAEIFVVGWNNGGTFIPDQGIKEIQHIANTAQIGEGVVKVMSGDKTANKSLGNYLITYDWNDVRSFYTAIHASMTDSDVEEIKDGVFRLDSPEIVEAEVIISSTDTISSLNVLDPQGDSMQESKTFSVSGSDQYKVIKIVSPKLGKYTVQAVTKDPSALKQMLIKKYAVEIKATTTLYTNDGSFNAAIKTPYIGVVKVVPVYKGEPYTKDDFIDSVTECSYFVNEGDKEKLTFDSEEQTFKGYFPIIGAGDYTVKATMATSNMSRTAICILEADTPIKRLANGGYTYDLGDIKVKRGGEKIVDVSEQYPTLSLMLNEVHISGSGKPIVETETIGRTQIMLKGRKTGETELYGQAADETGNQWEITGTVQVAFGFFIYEIILIILGILLFVALLIFVIYKRDQAHGHFTIKIENIATGAEKKRELPDHPHGRSFSLWKLVETLTTYMQSGVKLTEEERGLIDAAYQNKKAISKKTLYISRCQTKDGVKYKTYKAREGKNSYELNGPVYQSNNLRISLEFRPFSVNTDFGNGGFGGKDGFGDTDGFGDNSRFGGKDDFGNNDGFGDFDGFGNSAPGGKSDSNGSFNANFKSDDRTGSWNKEENNEFFGSGHNGSSDGGFGSQRNSDSENNGGFNSGFGGGF